MKYEFLVRSELNFSCELRQNVLSNCVCDLKQNVYAMLQIVTASMWCILLFKRYFFQYDIEIRGVSKYERSENFMQS